MRDQFGEQIEFKGNQASWQGHRVADFVLDALSETPRWSRALWLGKASPRAVRLAAQCGVDLSGKHLNLAPSEVRKIDRDHRQWERRADQRPLTTLDWELLPHVWREPDAVSPGARPGDLKFEKTLVGRSVFVVWQTGGPAVNLKTLYVKRG